MNTNQISLILNIVLLFAVAVLYYLHFSSSSPTSSSSTGNSSVPAGQQVVYINTDSLVLNYDYVSDLQKDLEERRNNAEKQLVLKQRQFQQEAESFQKRFSAGLMTENEAKNTQSSLLQKEQTLRIEEQNLAAGLMETERKLNAQWLDSVITYLKEYNKDKNYQFIFGFQKGGTILLSNDKLDITNDVLKGLNDRYKAVKNTTSKTEPNK
ncbi:OmpH family outer membrane protein [Thermoflexibacter ruber]|uniref:Periplasmic chaperone for outer membrane proteins Skp n=1 Tax=Thermoflexibacter ruber TaxID=1003 RepID=A0A1I2E7T8_9BACT|nr:OmpH family outer membrane protein [Thermoflexibacter ruber]SFE88699.1 periplasmic chaperone for outer membrane proteins Skp [Thermoflexibacter ruber]